MTIHPKIGPAKKLSRLLILASICSLPVSEAYADDVYLIIGQSNAAGRGALASNSPTMDGVEVLNDNGDFVPATPNLNQFSTIRKDIDGYNLGYTFGGVMHDATGRDIKLVVNARGGTNINAWADGASERYFDEAVDRVNEALETRGTELAGILWHQGESNRNSSTYLDRLTTLIEDFRDAFGEPDLPFIVGQLSQVRDDNINFNRNILTLPDLVSDTAVATSENLVTNGDETHFTTEDLRELGLRYATQMLSLQGTSDDSPSENPVDDPSEPPTETPTDDDPIEIPDFGGFPDVNQTYYLRSLKGNLLAADSNDVWAAAGSTTGSSVEWKFVQTGNHYYIERAAGGNTPRLRAVDAKAAELTTSSFSGADARFLIEERTSGSDEYNITAVDNGRELFQRLVLSPVTRDAGMTSTDKSGSWTTFEIIEK